MLAREKNKTKNHVVRADGESSFIQSLFNRMNGPNERECGENFSNNNFTI